MNLTQCFIMIDEGRYFLHFIRRQITIQEGGILFNTQNVEKFIFHGSPPC